jgi:TolB-like protein/Flp pilus assembly protein TadD
MSLFSELKRRNVIRVATAYVVAAWLVIQVVETVLPAYGLGDAAIRLVVTLLAIAFIPAMVFSWVFEITPEGLKREVDVASEHSITRFTGKKLDRIIMMLLALALGYFAFDKFVLDPARDIELATTAAQSGAEQALKAAKEAAFPGESIAVLPFADMSPNKDQEYFSDGLSDTLIHVLAQVSGLKVTAKTSSFYFKGKNIDVGEIARELRVGTILEGSVQKAGNRVRVIAQLINAIDGTHLWSKSFDRDLQDIFAVQDEIAQEVVKALKVTLLDTEEERLAQRYRPTLEAYEQLVLGRHEMAKRTAASLAAAEQRFKKAIELDSDYALAYVELARTFWLQISYGSLTTEESLQRQQPLVDKALELDPLSGEAHIARAMLSEVLQIKTAEDYSNAVEENVLKAIKLNPNYAYAHFWYSGLLHDQGRLEEALAQMRLAAELDPMSPNLQLNVAGATWDLGRAEEAIMLIRRNIERTPEFPNNYFSMAVFQARLGHLGEAQRWVQEARRRDPVDGYTWFRECVGFLNLGDALSAEDCAKQLSEAHPEKSISRGSWISLHAYRGEWNAAIAIVQSALERMPGFLPFYRWLANWAAGQGDVERARSLMADAFPELLEDGLGLATFDLHSALVFAAILNANGETQRRDVLLLALEERIASMHRTHGEGYGILDVHIHAMRGDRDQAIAGLREAIDVGWRVSWTYPRDASWWMLRQDWKLASLHQDPEFIAMVNELEADINAQRQWYEENKDKPLF